MKSQAGNDNIYLHERRQHLSNRPPEEPSSKVTKTLESLTEGQRKLLSYLEGIRERANWIFSNIALKKMSFAKFRKNEYLQSSVVIKILQIGQIVSDMEVIFPSAGFWLEAKKKSGERQPVSKDMGIPFGKLSFIDIKSCRNDYSHAIDIDVVMLYKDATEFIPFIAKSVDTIMRDDFRLTEPQKTTGHRGLELRPHAEDHTQALRRWILSLSRGYPGNDRGRAYECRPFSRSLAR